jgi:hypothetical protein
MSFYNLPLPTADGGPSPTSSEVRTFLASGTITAGQWVNFDYSKTSTDKVVYVTVQDTSGGAVAIGVPVIGVAVSSTTAANQEVRVCIAGYCAVAAVATGSTSGLALALDTTTSGRATIADAANVNVCGVALADAVSNAAPVLVYRQV